MNGWELLSKAECSNCGHVDWSTINLINENRFLKSRVEKLEGLLQRVRETANKYQEINDIVQEAWAE